MEPEAIETLVIEGARSLLREHDLTVSDEPLKDASAQCRCGSVRGVYGNTVVGVGGVVHGVAGCHSN